VDKIGKNQIYRIIAGIILISIGIYLISLPVERLITSLVFLTGLTILINGIRYRARLNMKKLEGEERKAYLRSAPFIIMLTGTIILFTGLGGGLLASNLLHAGIVVFWFLGIAFIGMLLVFAGAIVKAADKTGKIQS
jgi:hypothetical protein